MFRKIPFDIPKINTQMDDVSTFENKKVVQKHRMQYDDKSDKSNNMIAIIIICFYM